MNKLITKSITVALCIASIGSIQAQTLVCKGQKLKPNKGWVDSVSVGNKCYCASTNFDHDIGGVKPKGFNGLTIVQICKQVGPPPAGKQIPYNDIQCGNGPANSAIDEASFCCPGRVDQGVAGCKKIGPKWDTSSIFGGNSGGGKTVTLKKRNAGFSLDGGNGGKNGQNVKLWKSQSKNKNQQWVEVNRGGGFFSYVKNGTSFALDAGNGGKNGQNIKLWKSQAKNQNQQWRKISKGGGSFQLQKRNSLGFSIDGGNGGKNNQNVTLHKTASNNKNQQWVIK